MEAPDLDSSLSLADGVDQLRAKLEDPRYDPLPREEEQRLARIAQESEDLEEVEEARRKLLEANLRFALHRAARWASKSSMSLEDCVGAAVEGAMIGVQKYQPGRDSKVITYAVWWIDQRLRKHSAVSEGTISRHQGTVYEQRKLKREVEKLERELGRPATDQEIKEETGISDNMLRARRQIARGGRLVRLDKKYGDEDSTDLHDQLPSDDSKDITPERASELEYLEAQFEEHLTERERKILVLYFGLDGGEDMTLKEVGQLVGVTRERIRQLRNRACEKLRTVDGLEETLRGLLRI